ncbi:hypothetical protein BDB01DRAFT_814864 [Pilobolus umbonatus]|nr:hypothetical protein BDB01DRAFT_814864 [Pilobolus umbonatus]
MYIYAIITYLFSVFWREFIGLTEGVHALIQFYYAMLLDIHVILWYEVNHSTALSSILISVWAISIFPWSTFPLAGNAFLSQMAGVITVFP